MPFLRLGSSAGLEHLRPKEGVVGSNPTRGTILKASLLVKFFIIAYLRRGGTVAIQAGASIQRSQTQALELPDSNTTGILLSQRLGSWNDDTDSTIIMMSTDQTLRASLQEKMKTCIKQ